MTQLVLLRKLQILNLQHVTKNFIQLLKINNFSRMRHCVTALWEEYAI